MSRRCTLLACAAALLAFAVFIALPARNAGQTADNPRARQDQAKKGDNQPAQVKKITALLDESMDVQKDLANLRNLKDFLLGFYERLNAGGTDYAIVVDDEA